MTVLASANVDETGFYVIAGSAWLECNNPFIYALRLYSDKLATFPVKLDNSTHDTIRVPREYVLSEYQPVKLYEKDINGFLTIDS